MALTKKETKQYKKLIESKFDEMGLVEGTELRYTGESVIKTWQNPTTGKDLKYKTPVIRKKNVRKNLMKKLLKLPKGEVDKFLATSLDKKEDQNEDVPADQ